MFLTLLTFISAISISVIAAGYSIIGLATLFAGAFIPIVAMGSALEVGKLVAASWLYHNWRSNIPKLLKTYLFLAIIILIFITSMGIFGFLSKAHLDQVKPTAGNTEQIALIDKQISQQEKIIERAEKTLFDHFSGHVRRSEDRQASSYQAAAGVALPRQRSDGRDQPLIQVCVRCCEHRARLAGSHWSVGCNRRLGWRNARPSGLGRVSVQVRGTRAAVGYQLRWAG